MVSTLPIPQSLVTDAWVKARWDEFVVLAEQLELEKAWFYYDQGYMRLEMAAVGPGLFHSKEGRVKPAKVRESSR